MSDGQLSGSETITIQVNNINRAPVLKSLGDQTVDEGQLLEFTVTAADPDGDELSCEASNLPGSAGFYGETFSWIPDFSQAGTYLVTFTVSDGQLTTDATVAITVNDVSPQAAIEDLKDIILTFALDKGTTNSLTSKLDAASASLERGNPDAARNQLNAFINQVQAQKVQIGDTTRRGKTSLMRSSIRCRPKKERN